MSCFCLLAQKEGCWDPSLSNFLHELLWGNVILLCTIYGRSVQGVSHCKKSAERLQSQFNSPPPSRPPWPWTSGVVVLIACACFFTQFTLLLFALDNLYTIHHHITTCF